MLNLLSDDTAFLELLIIKFLKLIYKMNEHQIRQEDIPAIIQKHFPQCKKESVKLTRLLGMTNVTYKVNVPEHKPYLFRIFVGVKNPKRDNTIYTKLAESKIAPECYYHCQSYRIQEFVQNAIHPDQKELRTNKKLIAQTLKQIHKFHQLKIQQFNQNQVFAQGILSQSTEKKISSLQTQDKQTHEHFQQFKNKLFDILKDKEKLKKKLTISNKDSIKICHNDINNLNIFLKNPNSENEKVILIDYDYMAYNYIAFDLANFINQTCFQYTQKYPGFQVIHRTTDEEIQYISSLYEGKYEGLARDIKKMLILCNLYWAIWSLESSINAVLSTFKPLVHGQARLQLSQYYYRQLFGDQ